MTAVRPSPTAVLAASALTLILAGRSGGPPATGEAALRAAARSVFVPLEAAGAAAFRPLEAAAAGVGGAGDAARARAELERAQERVRSEAARAEALETENRRLEAMLRLEEPLAGEGVAARVVSIPAGASGGAFLLDRGSGDGIRPGMPVVAAGGLVGRVVEVSGGHSTVLPVGDRASAVGVRVGPAGASGVAQGRSGPVLHLELLDPAAPVERGAVAVTSGLRHSRFPAGLPVGRVAGGAGRWVGEPVAPPDRLEVVKVLRWEPAS
ncbi:MAG TPA: rod shape-determining protein MreC [Acidimicrobiia bacterium]|nr:rod shape-determining protein MreC [Acidimicrobiia bacterium]